MNFLVYNDIDQGIHKVKCKIAQNEKQTKNYMGFSFSINMANFEAFCRNKKLSANVSFLKIESAAKVLKVINKNKY